VQQRAAAQGRVVRIFAKTGTRRQAEAVRLLRDLRF